MADIPRKAAARTAKLASLPLGMAGRVVGGWGRRLVGQNAEDVQADISARTAEQLFAVLGQLKGGAMKFGQALSVFEAAVPEELAEPYREALTKLQTAAPPMPVRTVHRVLVEQLGTGWTQALRRVRRRPRGVGEHRPGAPRGLARRSRRGGQGPVPGRGRGAARRPARSCSGSAGCSRHSCPGAEVKPLLAELRDRMVEELDYRNEADNERAFAAAFDGDKQVVRAEGGGERAEGDGHRMGDRNPARGDHPRRQRADPQRGRQAAGRVPLLVTGAGRAAARRPAPGQLHAARRRSARACSTSARARGCPKASRGRSAVMTRLAMERKSDELLDLLRNEHFIRPGSELTGDDVLSYLAPFTEPLVPERFHFTRRWLRRQAWRVGDTRGSDFQTGRSLNLPPQYLLIHRVTLGATGILCQLDAELPARAIVTRWQPGFAPEN